MTRTEPNTANNNKKEKTTMQTDEFITNETRAQRAESALQNYVEAKGETYEASSSEIADLVADLLHLSASLDEGDDPIESTLRLARMHFDAEQADHEEEVQP
ncbi:MAG: hypothetical protein DLM68_00385 [Hyphomicrobiales bacterium]|nr:MAG: hypothetical protein DLM68_00385 [Hyphomicrobiales bacterium]